MKLIKMSKIFICVILVAGIGLLFSAYDLIEAEEVGEILDFTFEEDVVEEVNIDPNEQEVVVTVKHDTDKDGLTPLITVSEEHSLQPESGVSQDFNVPVEYEVICDETGETWEWKVIVEKAYLFKEDFSQYELGELPSDWKATGDISNASIVNNAPNKENVSVLQVKKGTRWLKKKMDSIDTKKILLKFKVYYGGWRLAIQESMYETTYVDFKAMNRWGWIGVQEPNGLNEILSDLDSEKWMEVSVMVNFDTNEIYFESINGFEIPEDESFKFRNTDLNKDDAWMSLYGMEDFYCSWISAIEY